MESSSARSKRTTPAHKATKPWLIVQTKDPAEAEYYQAMERAWLIMALISMALSDLMLIQRNRGNRQLVDRARKALFDLHAKLDRSAQALPRRPRSNVHAK